MMAHSQDSNTKSMPSRLNTYQSKQGEDGMEVLSAKLSADVRGNIRSLGNFPLLSEEWCQMATTLGRIAEISEAEAKLARECSREERKEGGKTLWEGEELALRYILEDGKLNVCLRNLVEWRNFDRKTLDGIEPVREKQSVVDSLDSFEKGMGTILRNAWTHIEALQTTDIPLLVEYITGVLKEATEDPNRVESMSKELDLGERQEVVCLSYLRGLVSCMSDYEEERVMPHLRSAHTASRLAEMLHVNHKHIGMESSAIGAEALAYVCGTEDFRTFRGEYITDENKETFAALRGDFVAELCKDPNERKKLRPLLDAISYCERLGGRK